MKFIENLEIEPLTWFAISVGILIVLLIILAKRSKSKAKINSVVPLTYKSVPAGSMVTTRVVEDDPIERTAEILGRHTAEIKAMLNIPMTERSAATTVDEAEEEFDEAATYEEEYAALVKWLELENGVANMEYIYDTASDYPSLQAKIIVKWTALSLKEIETANTEEELETAAENAPQQTLPLIAEKLYKLYQKV